MTESEWLASTNPNAMLDHLRGKVSNRKLRLFACACCRNVWHLLTDDRSRLAVEVAERYADHQITKEELAAAEVTSWNAWDASPPGDCARFAWAAAWSSAEIAWSSAEIAWDAARNSRIGVWKKECDLFLLGDIFGNLFRPVAIDPVWLAWHGGSVVSMAQQMYDSRDFAAMPILADALEDAGCTNEDILNHCRGFPVIYRQRCKCGGEYRPLKKDRLPMLSQCIKCLADGPFWADVELAMKSGPHVRGCWVLDLLLGKE